MHAIIIALTPALDRLLDYCAIISISHNNAQKYIKLQVNQREFFGADSILQSHAKVLLQGWRQPIKAS